MEKNIQNNDTWYVIMKKTMCPGLNRILDKKKKRSGLRFYITKTQRQFGSINLHSLKAGMVNGKDEICLNCCTDWTGEIELSYVSGNNCLCD